MILDLSLLRVKKFFYRRFKNHDRLYWISPDDKLQCNGKLTTHIEDMENQEVSKHVKANAIELKGKQRVVWKLLEYEPDP